MESNKMMSEILNKNLSDLKELKLIRNYRITETTIIVLGMSDPALIFYFDDFNNSYELLDKVFTELNIEYLLESLESIYSN